MGRFRIVVAAVMAALAVAGCNGKTASNAASTDDMTLGDPNAKVTVVEYASVGCPVCAKWDREIWPAFKAKSVDTKKIKFVYREMLVGAGPEVAVAASGFLLARCAGPDKYFTVLDTIYGAQQQAFQAPRDTLLDIARSAGMTEAQFNICINDEKAILALNDRVDRHVKNDHIDSTPTFVVNGKMLTPGFHELADLDAAIAEAAK